MSEAATTVYWRPGCGFCSSLLRALERFEVPHGRVDIWEEPDAAAFVRSVADGNETVPTVAVGQVALVNPTLHDVLGVLLEVAPDEVPAGYEPPDPGRVAKLLNRFLG